MKSLLTVLIISLLIFSNASAQTDDDILGKILAGVGFDRADIGYQPAGYWNRFPLDAPYRLTSFDALFAEPFKLIDYATVMGNTVEFYLDPAYADSASDGLYKLVYNLGVDKKLGGFRSYSANLLDAPDGDQPLLDAITSLYALAGQRVDPGAVASQLSVLPDTVQTILAQLIVNLADAIEWRNLAFRNCDPYDMQKAFEIRDLADTQNDGQIYYAELDDIAATIDYPSLHYAALKVAAAAEQAEKAMRPLVGIEPIGMVRNNRTVDIPTPFGKILILTPGMQPVSCKDTTYLLIFDFGRHCTYTGSVGATASLSNPVSVVIDLGGDDYYGFDEKEHSPTSGVGLLGVGLVIDSDGDDHYNGSVYAQGAGLFGVGVLLDRNGNDQYKAELSAQGCGYFGIGLCLDAMGDDTYYIYGDGQGMGGIGGGIGVLASFDGNDKYEAEISPDIYNRADYHSDQKINGNNVQGAGFGRRGDMTDGHSWAGGLGAIIDIHGNDHYYSGNWSLGIAYWFSTGIALDRNGDDIYESCYFTQGSGAHFCNAILLDESGNDRHELYETAGAALGFGWDFTNAFLINKGGNDSYRAKMISMGLAQIRSNAFLIDIGGDDVYYLGKGTPGLGEATYMNGMQKPLELTPYYYYAKSFGGFIDIGGTDSYYEFDDSTASADSTDESGSITYPAHSIAHDDSMWFQPARTDSTFGSNNYGVGIDIENGTIPELFLWD